MKEITPKFLLIWDQTGIHPVPGSTWTMDKMGSKHVEITRANDKQKITDVFCGSAAKDLLPLQLVNKNKTKVVHCRSS